MWFLREQFFPQTLPSIIYMQLPLDIATFLDAADYLVSGQGYKTVVSVGSPSCGLGAGSAAMRKALEQAAGAAHGPAAPLLVRVGEPLTTLLPSWCGIAGWLRIAGSDQNLPEREDSALRPSPLCFAQKPIRLQPGTHCNHVCQHNHLRDFLHISLLKTVTNSTRISPLLLRMGGKIFP